MLEEYLVDLERTHPSKLEGAPPRDPWLFAHKVLLERARSHKIDFELEREAERLQLGGVPYQVLLVGRVGAGKREFLDAVQGSLPVVDAHTSLAGSGIRQLCVHACGRSVSLVDIGGSHSAAATNPASLRKATQHFDGIAGAIFQVALDALTSQEELALTAELLHVIAKCLRKTGNGGGELPHYAPLFILLNKMDLATSLLESEQLLEAIPELVQARGEAELLNAVREACLSKLPSAAMASTYVYPLSLRDPDAAKVAIEAVASQLPPPVAYALPY